jgi:hypothetical protein
MLDCSVRGVLCGEVFWTAVCVAFCVERNGGLQCARRALWVGIGGCSVSGNRSVEV